MQKKYVMGLELGGSRLRACLGNDQGKIYCIKTDSIDFSHKDKGLTEQVLGIIKKTLKEARLSVDEILALGIGAAGHPDKEKGIISYAANCPWKVIKFPGVLEKKLKIPIYMRNDVAIAVYAARERGYGSKFSQLFPRWDAAMTIGTGTNLALMYNGELLLSPRNESLEWGHCKLNTDSKYMPECGCGGRGCIESYIGGSGIRTRTIDLLKKKSGELSRRNPVLRETLRRISKGKKHEKIKTPDLVKSVRAEDVYAAFRKTKGRDRISKKIVDDTSTYMAYAFGNILSSYPLIPYVEIFGAVAINNPKLTVEAAVKKLEKDPERFCNRNLKNLHTEFLVTGMDNIGLHGAVELAWFGLNKH